MSFPHLKNVRKFDQSAYQNTVITRMNEQILAEEREKKRKRQIQHLRILQEIEQREIQLEQYTKKENANPQNLAYLKANIHKLKMREKAVRKLIERARKLESLHSSTNNMDVNLTHQRNSEDNDVVMLDDEEEEEEKKKKKLEERNRPENLVRRGVLTPFEALAQGKDNVRDSKVRIRRTEKKVDSQKMSTKRVGFTIRRFNPQRLRVAKGKTKKKRVVQQDVSQRFKKRKRIPNSGTDGDDTFLDDGDEEHYRKRLKKQYNGTSFNFRLGGDQAVDFDEIYERSNSEVFRDDGSGEFRVPGEVNEKLFNYQRTCVKWLWQLHYKNVGGILGDEMGLGKTIEIITFLGSLHYSGLYSCALIIVPTTVMQQWTREFHKWWPHFRVVIYHSSGTYSGNDKILLDSVRTSSNGVLITTYESVRSKTAYFCTHDWGYVILDEGHRIKNPDSEITLALKQLNTTHRIILTGTPIQNQLKELWSLFDFVFPGLLGTLPIFQTQFGIPIAQGQYANASEFQVLTAYKCALKLRELIGPYLLRRLKSEVGAELPQKTEQILFCKLTKYQLKLYQNYLQSREVKEALSTHYSQKNSRKRRGGVVFKVVSVLRQICNHPDIVNHDFQNEMEEGDFGEAAKSGKMKVVEEILAHWKQGNNRVLLYSQSLKMLNILELFLERKEYSYLRMDGNTVISDRSILIKKFNSDPSIFVFLLTTKVGGIGINLTGADRVILFDPDWNPSVDIQSLERAYRIGQEKDVAVYRLMTSGTIEEKMYHRQIFKTFLTNKILCNPKQRRFFKTNRLYDLFVIGDEYEEMLEDIENEKHDPIVIVDSEDSDDDDDLYGVFEMVKPKKKKKVKRRKRRRKRRKGRTETAELFKESEINVDNFQKSNNLVRIEDYQKVEQPNQRQKGGRDDVDVDLQISQQQQPSETNLIQKLFDLNSVHNVIDHDKIINRSLPEKRLIEHESLKIAQQAAKELQKSKEICHRFSVTTPTWTGRSGVAGRVLGGKQRRRNLGNTQPNRPQMENSSANMLQTIQRNQEMNSMVEGNAKEKERRVMSNVDLLKRIRGFFLGNGGRVTSDQLVEKFDNITGQKVFVFKELLKQVAVLRNGEWVLKRAYY